MVLTTPVTSIQGDLSSQQANDTTQNGDQRSALRNEAQSPAGQQLDSELTHYNNDDRSVPDVPALQLNVSDDQAIEATRTGIHCALHQADGCLQPAHVHRVQHDRTYSTAACEAGISAPCSDPLLPQRLDTIRASRIDFVRTFPAELVDAVFCHFDTAFLLKTCAMVSKTWRNRLLLECRNTWKTVDLCFPNLTGVSLDALKSVASCVRKLEIESPTQLWADHNFPKLRLFNGLKSFSCSGYRGPLLQHIPPPALRDDMLETLRIACPNLFSLKRILNDFPNLKTLEYTDYSFDPFNVEIPLPRNENLLALRLRIFYKRLPFTEAVALSKALPNLRWLCTSHVTLSDWGEIRDWWHSLEVLVLNTEVLPPGCEPFSHDTRIQLAGDHRPSGLSILAIGDVFKTQDFHPILRKHHNTLRAIHISYAYIPPRDLADHTSSSILGELSYDQLRELSLQCESSNFSCDSVKSLFTRSPHLESFSMLFMNCTNTSGIASILGSHYPQLRKLKTLSLKCTINGGYSLPSLDEYLLSLSFQGTSCPLQSLSLIGIALTAEQLYVLADIRSLTKLAIGNVPGLGARPYAYFCKALQTHPRLETLEIAHLPKFISTMVLKVLSNKKSKRLKTFHYIGALSSSWKETVVNVLGAKGITVLYT